MRPVTGAVSLSLRAERGERALGRRAEDAALAALDAVLASRVGAEAVDQVLASDLAARAVGRAPGPAGRGGRQGRGPLPVLSARRRVATTPPERLLARARQPRRRAVLVRVLESKLLDEAVHRLLEGEELWLVVNEIAQSPAVTEAITRQSIGFADQVAGGVRGGSRSADAWLSARPGARSGVLRPAP